jgi:dTDP-4-dehydrorhamnose reductase
MQRQGVKLAHAAASHDFYLVFFSLKLVFAGSQDASK